MKRAVFVMVVVAVAFGLHAQEHAPRVETCRADGSLWITETMDIIRSYGYRELAARSLEMGQCSQTDPRNSEEYMSVVSGYEVEMHSRMQKFLMNHNQYNEFLAEDAQEVSERRHR